MIAYRYVHAESLIASLAKINVSVFLSVVLLVAAQLVVYAIRLHFIARCCNANFTVKQATLANFELTFISQLAPTQVVGDAARILRARRSGLTWDESVTCIALDRVIGLVVLLFVAPLILLWVDPAALGFPLKAALIGLPIVALLGCAMIVLTLPLLLRYRTYRAIKFAVTFAETLRNVVEGGPGTLAAASASLVGHGLLAMSMCLIANASGTALAFQAAFPAAAMITIASFLPISIGAWGVREGAAILVFGLLGIQGSDALTISIVLGLATMVVGVIGALVWLFSPALEVDRTAAALRS
jgi:uncharacterized membrane protein YbhN (UPF0104 family)